MSRRNKKKAPPAEQEEKFAESVSEKITLELQGKKLAERAADARPFYMSGTLRALDYLLPLAHVQDQTKSETLEELQQSIMGLTSLDAILSAKSTSRVIRIVGQPVYEGDRYSYHRWTTYSIVDGELVRVVDESGWWKRYTQVSGLLGGDHGVKFGLQQLSEYQPNVVNWDKSVRRLLTKGDKNGVIAWYNHDIGLEETVLIPNAQDYLTEMGKSTEEAIHKVWEKFEELCKSNLLSIDERTPRNIVEVCAIVERYGTRRINMPTNEIRITYLEGLVEQGGLLVEEEPNVARFKSLAAHLIGFGDTALSLGYVSTALRAYDAASCFKSEGNPHVARKLRSYANSSDYSRVHLLEIATNIGMVNTGVASYLQRHILNPLYSF